MSLNEKNIIHVVGEDIADPHVEVRIRLRANVAKHALESCYEVHAPGGMPANFVFGNTGIVVEDVARFLAEAYRTAGQKTFAEALMLMPGAEYEGCSCERGEGT